MKVFISLDIEGVAGVTHPDQVRMGNAEYERARRWMSAEANAAVRGAFAGGAQEVNVADGHGDFRNLIIDMIDPRATVTQGKPRLLGMFEGIEQGYDLVFMVGHHARAGSHGTLAHTINSTAFAEARVNGQPVGEADLYGALAGEYGAAVALLSGDDVFIDEISPRYPQAKTVITKHASHGNNRAARHLNPAHACEAIERAAFEAMALYGKLTPTVVAPSINVEVTTLTPAHANLFAMLPLLERRDVKVVGFTAPSMAHAVRVLNSLSSMAASLH